MRLTFLGTGTSNGIPVIGCNCDVCRSSDPRDRRTRSSAVIEDNGRIILIDTSPELRLQAVANGIDRIDAVVYTHAHADHVAGFDDLRSYNYLSQRHLDVYVDQFTAGILRERFAYAFEHPFPFYGGKPDLNLHVFDGPFQIGDTSIVPFKVQHGRWLVNGFRFEHLVYLTDAKHIPAESMNVMRGADVLVINGLRDRPHPVHLSIPEALQVIQTIRPKQAYITHVSHDVSHELTTRGLPANVHLAYDGLSVDIDEVVAGS